jgi:HNH endonuclease
LQIQLTRSRISVAYCPKGIRKAQVDKKGYLRIQFKVSRRVRTFSVHRLVLTTFVGPCPPGKQCRHLNGKKADNRPENLKWGTSANDARDRIVHGTSGHKLKQRDATAIWEAKGSRGIGKALAKRYGVSRSTISMIRSGPCY